MKSCGIKQYKSSVYYASVMVRLSVSIEHQSRQLKNLQMKGESWQRWMDSPLLQFMIHLDSKMAVMIQFNSINISWVLKRDLIPDS